MRRIIGKYTQGRPGPLLVCVGGMHGNERAGVKALDLLIKMLEVEPITNPDFKFFGKIVAVAGNLGALKSHRRYISADLNRIWKKRMMDNPGNEAEFGEMIKLRRVIDNLVFEWGGNSIYLMDIHTTTADGGFFLLPTKDKKSMDLAESMLSPAITGLVEMINGAMIRHYAERQDADITTIVFEAGQHMDPLSVNRAIASIINCMTSIGSVLPRDIENEHHRLLVDYCKDLPRISRLLYGHHVEPHDRFVMQRGFRNFDIIKKGEVLARDRHGDVLAKEDGMILMPLYQPQGEDGFFVITPE